MRIRKRVFVTLPELMDELELSTLLKVSESTRLKSRKIDTNGQSSLAGFVFETGNFSKYTDPENQKNCRS